MADWKQWNKAMDNMIYYYMQKKLGDERAKNNMEYLQASQEGYKYLEKLRKDYQLEIEGKKNEFDKGIIQLEAVTRANEDSTLQRYKVLAQLQPEMAEHYMAQYDKALEALIKGVMEERKGQPTAEGLTGVFGGAGLKMGDQLRGTEIGAREFEQELPIKQMEADIKGKQAETGRMGAVTDMMQEERLGEAGLTTTKTGTTTTGRPPTPTVINALNKKITQATEKLEGMFVTERELSKQEERQEKAGKEVPYLKQKESGLTQEEIDAYASYLSDVSLEITERQPTEQEKTDISKAIAGDAEYIRKRILEGFADTGKQEGGGGGEEEGMPPWLVSYSQQNPEKFNAFRDFMDGLLERNIVETEEEALSRALERPEFKDIKDLVRKNVR